MKQIMFIVFVIVIMVGCRKSNEKTDIHITNNRSNVIKVEFRAGSTVCSGTYVNANSTVTDEAYAGEYDVYVSDWDGVSGTQGPFIYYSHGLFYGRNEYVTVH